MKAIDELIQIGFACDICGHFEANYEDLRKHIRRKHPNYDERHISDLALVGYSCQDCGRFTRQYNEAKEHVRTMHNELVTNSPRHKLAREVRQP
ncbi:MAG: C2H2-type zinc finger protein [Thermoproteota archaeon]